MPDQRFGLVAERYKLRDQLGHGGMGRVWLAHDEMLHRDVAVKEVAPPTLLSAEEATQLRTLILREARAAARINHPHVVKIFDVLQTEEWPWLIMEYVPSRSLQRVVQLGGPLPPVEVAQIGLAMLEALNAAHDSGVLHRDVKPDNVLLADDGRVMLSDFGLASLDTDGKNTRSGTLGTPQYVAPERARHGISSREADLWSLGATLYAAVEGRSPYGRDSVLETLSALAVDPPDPMRLAGPLEPVIAGLLQRDPARRTHPDHLAQQLMTVIEGGRVAPQPAQTPTAPPPPPPPPAPPVPEPKRHWGRNAAIAAAGAIALTVAIGLIASAANKRDNNTLTAPTVSPSPSKPPLSPLACENSPQQATRVPPGGLPGPNQDPLPPGWTWFNDPGGFAVGVPQEWDHWQVGNVVCFRDPHGSRVLSIVPGRVPAETLPGYQMISRTDLDLRGPATEFEFTFTGPDRKRHAIALVTPGPTVLWVTDDFDFSTSRALYDLVKVSFDAGRPPGPPPPKQQPRPTHSP